MGRPPAKGCHDCCRPTPPGRQLRGGPYSPAPWARTQAKTVELDLLVARKRGVGPGAAASAGEHLRQDQAAQAPASSAKLSTRRMRSAGMSRTLYHRPLRLL